ncbi:MAG: cysteine-rich small domain-containing protein [Promethearchaeota archaeon]
MIEKGRLLIKKAMEKKKIIGLDRNCNYLPCHENIEDCTFCYCPFYPCNQTDTGGFEKISSRTGQPVWACSSCTLNHKTANAEKIIKGLLELNENFDLISREQLLKLREKIVKEENE